MNDNKDIKFTGDPVAFNGVEGKRDPKTGKGRFDLIPTEVYYPLFSEADHEWLFDCHPASILMSIANEKFIDAIIKMTIYSYAKYNEDYVASSLEFWHGVWPMLQDLAIHFQKGAEHYGERNCQKGIPLWSFKDSAMRHATQVFEGKTDEPHKISVIWNCWMAQWTIIQQNAAPKFYPDKYIMTSDHKLQPSHPGEEWKPTKQQVDVIIRSDREIPQDQRDKMKKFCMQMRDKLTKLNFEFGDGKDKWDKLIDEMAENAKEAGIPWPPKEPKIVPDTRDDHSRTMLSDSPEFKDKKSDIDEMKKIIDELVHLSNELEIPVVTAQQTSYTREEVEAIKKEAADKAIKDFLKDRRPENIDRIIKEIGAQNIIERLKTIPLNERRLFDTQFADLLNTPEGKDRARWFYGPDDLLKDLIDRVENKRGYGRDYRDYVPLLIKLNRAFEEYLQEKNHE